MSRILCLANKFWQEYILLWRRSPRSLASITTTRGLSSQAKAWHSGHFFATSEDKWKCRGCIVSSNANVALCQKVDRPNINAWLTLLSICIVSKQEAILICKHVLSRRSKLYRFLYWVHCPIMFPRPKKICETEKNNSAADTTWPIFVDNFVRIVSGGRARLSDNFSFSNPFSS